MYVQLSACVNKKITIQKKEYELTESTVHKTLIND